MELEKGMRLRFRGGRQLSGSWTVGKVYQVGYGPEDLAEIIHNPDDYEQFCFIDDDFGEKVFFFGSGIGKYFEKASNKQLLL